MTNAAVLAAEGDTNNFLIPNGTFIFEWIVFGLVLFVIWKKILPPIAKRIEQRQEAIRKEIEEAENAKKEAEKAKEEYNTALEQVRSEISRLREEANAEKQQIISEARTTARQEAETVAEQERAKLATERQQVLLSLRNEIGELAFTLSEKIVRDSLRDEDRQRRLVDDFIAGVGAHAEVEASR